jgi:hypothetical protein
MAYDIAYYERVAHGLAEASAASRKETNPEAALLIITECARLSVGDPTARERPGAVNPGDPDFRDILRRPDARPHGPGGR